MNKRANGEGSLRKRPDGRWEGRYTVGIDPKTGKRISKSVFGKTQAECKNKLRTAIAENRGPAINFKGDYTVGDGCGSGTKPIPNPISEPPPRTTTKIISATTLNLGWGISN